MTIGSKTVGTATTGNNASVTPGTPSGLADRDLMVIIAAIRNTGATVNTPAGWARVTASGNVVALARFFAPGDTMPLVTFTGGGAGDDTFAQAYKWRSVSADQAAQMVFTQQSNTTAQNIAWPALNVPGANHALIMALWKQDDCTSIATPAGWTSDGLTNQTTGNDQLVQLYSQIQTTETDISASSAVVTGGATAVSQALMLALKPAASIAVLEQDVYPPRVLVTLSGLTPGDDVAVYRVAGATRTAVRAGAMVDVTDPAFLVVDAELPFGEPVYYVGVVNELAEYASTPVTYTLPGGKVAVTDAITGLAAEAVIMSWPEKDYQRPASTFKVGGRNVVITGDLGMFEGSIELFFDAYSSGQNLLTTLESATEGIVQIRRPDAAYDGVDCYVAVTAGRERRFSQDGSDPRRTWVLDVAEVEPWSDGLAAQGFTYADLEAAYTGLTYADLAGDYATYLDLAQADLS